MDALKNFRTYFFRGLAALLPTVLTIWIFVQCYVFIQDKISIHINRGIVHVILWTTDQYSKEFLVDFWVNGSGKIAGLFAAALGVVFIGAFLASVMGRTIWRFIEKALVNIPLFRSVYPHIKQVTDFLLTKKNLAFSKVVALEYPRKGMWSIGLVTGKGLKSVVKTEDFLTVFVPTSPTPFTGYVVMIPKNETIELDLTIEEALRFIISGGVITPAEHLAFKKQKLNELDEQKPVIQER